MSSRDSCATSIGSSPTRIVTKLHDLIDRNLRSLRIATGGCRRRAAPAVGVLALLVLLWSGLLAIVLSAHRALGGSVMTTK